MNTKDDGTAGYCEARAREARLAGNIEEARRLYTESEKRRVQDKRSGLSTYNAGLRRFGLL
jgi:hypothetical protein